MDFKKEYLELKQRNLTDKEIQGELNITNAEMYALKKHYEIRVPRKKRKNYLGFTEEMLLKGESIGLSRRVMYKRVRALNWRHKEAISIPLITAKGKGREKV